MNGFTRPNPISVECLNRGRRFGYIAQVDQNLIRRQLKGTGWDLTATVYMHTVFIGWVNNTSQLNAT